MCVVFNGTPYEISVVTGKVTSCYCFQPDGREAILGTCEEASFGTDDSRIELTSRFPLRQDEYSAPKVVGEERYLANGGCALVFRRVS